MLPRWGVLWGIVGTAVAGAGLWAHRRGIRGGLACPVSLELPDQLTLTGVATRARRPEPTLREDLRQPLPGQPYPFRPSEPYSREQALGMLPSADPPVDLCGGRFLVLKDAIVAFLDRSELRFTADDLFEWCPAEAYPVSDERPTWLPFQLRDGSARARRGVALFIRWDQGPYIYAGKAELSSWPVGQDEPRCARFTTERPVQPPADWKGLKVSDALEADLGRIRPDVERTGLTEVQLRKIARGDRAKWSELMDTLIDQDVDYGAVKIITPFLLTVLKEASVPFSEDILWLLAMSREDESWGAKAAAAAGVEVYLTFLHHPQPDIRRAAAFALQTCTRADFAAQARAHVREEKDERVQAALLLALLDPGKPDDLPLFLEILKQSASPLVKTVAALMAVESSPAPLPPDAARHLRQNAGTLQEFEVWWFALDLACRMTLEPTHVLRSHGLMWDVDDDHGELLNTLARLSKPDLVRCMIAAAEVELYERALTAEETGCAELALAAARAWLKDPTSGALEDKARDAGAEATKLLAGAAATACGRMPDLAAKTCLDALTGLPNDLQRFALARIRETLGR